jgi:hypothetical protein
MLEFDASHDPSDAEIDRFIAAKVVETRALVVVAERYRMQAAHLAQCDAEEANLATITAMCANAA